MVLELAGGYFVRLDLVTIFKRSIAGGSEGDLSLEDGGVGADVNPPLTERANARRQ
jgi:hypothetical protein